MSAFAVVAAPACWPLAGCLLGQQSKQCWLPPAPAAATTAWLPQRPAGPLPSRIKTDPCVCALRAKPLQTLRRRSCGTLPTVARAGSRRKATVALGKSFRAPPACWPSHHSPAARPCPQSTTQSLPRTARLC
eukprot:COSAG01_NODE_425_length_17240_cov_29.899306_26_plen_132_part_00